jgi:hypothetical protein
MKKFFIISFFLFFGAVAIALISYNVSNEKNKRGDSSIPNEIKTMNICNSIIPQKYPNWDVKKKMKMIRLKNKNRWSWRLSKGSQSTLLTCLVSDDGKYEVTKQDL